MEFHIVKNASIKNITLTNGHSSFYDKIPNRLKNREHANAKHQGGGVYCYNSNPCFENVTITENFADQGGGIYCYKSSPNLLNVIISNNSAYFGGGGMYCYWHSNPKLNYVNIFWYKIPLLSVGGTDRYHLTNGLKNWIKDAGLEKDYKVENIFNDAGPNSNFCFVTAQFVIKKGVLSKEGLTSDELDSYLKERPYLSELAIHRETGY